MLSRYRRTQPSRRYTLYQTVECGIYAYSKQRKIIVIGKVFDEQVLRCSPQTFSFLVADARKAISDERRRAIPTPLDAVYLEPVLACDAQRRETVIAESLSGQSSRQPRRMSQPLPRHFN